MPRSEFVRGALQESVRPLTACGASHSYQNGTVSFFGSLSFSIVWISWIARFAKGWLLIKSPSASFTTSVSFFKKSKRISPHSPSYDTKSPKGFPYYNLRDGKRLGDFVVIRGKCLREACRHAPRVPEGESNKECQTSISRIRFWNHSSCAKNYSPHIFTVCLFMIGAVDRCSFISEEFDGWMFSGRCLRV